MRLISRRLGRRREARIPVTVNERVLALVDRGAAGKIVFEVTNGGSDIGEFEVLSGTRVVDEVENIVPGFVINFTTRLDGGYLRADLLHAAVAARHARRVRWRGADSAVQRRRRRGHLSGYQAAYSEPTFAPRLPRW